MTSIVKMYNQINKLRRLIREQGTPDIQDAWEKVEQFIDQFFKRREE